MQSHKIMGCMFFANVTRNTFLDKKSFIEIRRNVSLMRYEVLNILRKKHTHTYKHTYTHIQTHTLEL